MRRITLALLLSMTVATACAPRPAAGAPEQLSIRNDLITRPEMEARYYANAFDLVAALRPNWLHERGQETLGQPIELQVHYNGIHIGGIALLREMPVADLAYIEYVDPIAATARWGLGYGKGAVILSTKPKG